MTDDKPSTDSWPPLYKSEIFKDGPVAGLNGISAEQLADRRALRASFDGLRRLLYRILLRAGDSQPLIACAHQVVVRRILGRLGRLVRHVQQLADVQNR